VISLRLLPPTGGDLMGDYGSTESSSQSAWVSQFFPKSQNSVLSFLSPFSDLLMGPLSLGVCISWEYMWVGGRGGCGANGNLLHSQTAMLLTASNSTVTQSTAVVIVKAAHKRTFDPLLAHL
jgi:hypothetical protein